MTTRVRSAECGVRSHARGWRATVFASTLLAACHSDLLLLDLQLTEPAVVAAVAEPWHAAGYRVAYRRFHPHLTRDDLGRYHTLVFLAGSRPERPSDAMTVGDAVVLREWVMRGGVAVLGYDAGAEGSLDRWTINRWLAWVGAGIAIGDLSLADTSGSDLVAFDPAPSAAAPPGSPLREHVFESFPAGLNHALHADGRRVLARVAPGAFVRPAAAPPEPRGDAAVLAAARIGHGLAIVTSRHFLGAAGPDGQPATTPLLPAAARARTRAALAALARLTRRPAEWASVPPARGGVALALLGGPAAVASDPPGKNAPAATAAVELQPAPAPAPATGRPGWIARQGALAAWTDVPPRTRAGLDSQVAFLEAAGMNLLATTVDARAMRDTLSDLIRIVTTRLQTTSVRWIPALPFARLAGDTGAWCPLDPAVWDRVAAAMRAAARLAPDVVPIIALDLPAPSGSLAAYCDGATVAALAVIGADSALTRRVLDQPVTDRRGVLLSAGLLPAYHAALERLVARRAAALRAELRRGRSGLLFAVRSQSPPADWLGMGLLRGLGDRQVPALLCTPEPRPAALLARYRALGVHARHLVGIVPAQVSPGTWRRLAPVVRAEHDGFWLALGRGVPRRVSVPGGEAPIAADSLARLVRRLAQSR